MSIFSSMTTAVLGLNAQSKALGHISDNIANASTTGYKRVDSAFETLVLQSNSRVHDPGGVVAQPVFMNSLQGNLSQVDNPTSAAIQGQGFFSVSKLSSGLTGPGQTGETVQTQTGTLNADNVYYTRVGDFSLDKNRYLVNSAGYALNGWTVDDANGQLKKDVVEPLQVNTLTDKPQATNNITLGANLPATPSAAVPDSSIQIFDTQGNSRTVQFSWRQDTANVWRLGIAAPGSSVQPVSGTLAGGDATLTQGVSTAGVTPVAQQSKLRVSGAQTIMPSTVSVGGRSNYYPDGTSQPNIRVGDTYSLTIDGGTTVTVGPLDTSGTANDISNFTNFGSVASALANKITYPYQGTIDANDPTKIIVTNLQDGTPVDVTGSFTNATTPSQNYITGPATTAATATTPQVSSFDLNVTNMDVGDEYRITVAGKTFATRVTQANFSAGTMTNASQAVQDLLSQINAAGIGVTASQGAAPNTNRLIVTSNTNGTTFASSAAVTNADSKPNQVANPTPKPATFTALTPTTTTAASLTTAQQSQVTFPSTTTLKVPDEYSITVGGQKFTTTVSYSNINALKDMDGVAADLASQVQAQATALGVGATSTGSTVVLTAAANNTPFTLSANSVAVNATDNVHIGDTYSVTVNGTKYALTVTADNITSMGTYAGIVNTLATQINSAQPSAPVIATVVNSELTLTARTAGTPYTATVDYTQANSTPNTVKGPTISDPTTTLGQQQVFSYPQTNIDVGDRYSVSIDGNPISVEVTSANYSNYGDITGVIQALANNINQANLNVTATASNGRLTITHNTPSTGKFAAVASVDNAIGASGVLSDTGQNTANVVGVRQQQQVTLTGSPGDIGATYTVSVNGTPVTYTTDGTETSMQDITTNLANLVNKSTSLPVTASAANGVLTLVAKTETGATADQFIVDTAAAAGKTPAYIGLNFGTDSDNVGTLTSVSTAKVVNGTAISSVSQSSGNSADITFTVDYGFGPQEVKLNLGSFGKSGGLTQYAGTEINVKQLVQDGAASGQFKEVVYGDNGDVIVNYDNGRSRVIGRIPVVTFNNPNALQRATGGVYTETDDAGRPNFNDPDSNGAGAVVANSVESSNVDIADEFTKLIVTQRTYSANTKIVTTSDEMLQEVLGLKR